MHSSPRSSNSLFSYFILTTSLLSTVYAQTTYQGCYAVDSTLVVNDTSIYQSTGRCNGEICAKGKYAVYGLTSGSQCWCGNSIPANQVTPDHCNLPCPGYPADTCGGTGYISVWLTGVGKLVGGAATDILSDTTTRAGATKTSGAGSSNTVYITAGQTTIIATPTVTDTSSGGGGGGISGGAAAGIAIGVLALIGIGAGAFFFIRRRRRDDYQKQYEGSHFGSSPGSLSRPFAPDQRLEPGMVQKRESVGSLADEQDYSRKILRVPPYRMPHIDFR